MRIDVYEVLGFGLARISQFKIKKSSKAEDFLFDFPYRNIVLIKVNCPIVEEATGLFSYRTHYFKCNTSQS